MKKYEDRGSSKISASYCKYLCSFSLNFSCCLRSGVCFVKFMSQFLTDFFFFFFDDSSTPFFV